jgi:predicted HicB family RNase H-like nuclease
MEHAPVKTAEPKIPLNVHIPVSLKRDVEAAADIAGQTLTVWVSRTLNAALRATAAANPIERQSSS